MSRSKTSTRVKRTLPDHYAVCPRNPLRTPVGAIWRKNVSHLQRFRQIEILLCDETCLGSWRHAVKEDPVDVARKRETVLQISKLVKVEQVPGLHLDLFQCMSAALDLVLKKKVTADGVQAIRDASDPLPLSVVDFFSAACARSDADTSMLNPC